MRSKNFENFKHYHSRSLSLTRYLKCDVIEATEKHRRIITQVIDSHPINVQTLRDLAPFGYVDDDLRKRVWMALLGIDQTSIEPHYYSSIYRHKEWNQVQKDINRSLNNFDTTKKLSKEKRKYLRGALSRIINSVLCCHTPTFSYIQGYHDICEVFLLVAGESIAFRLCEAVSLSYLRDFLRPEMDSIMELLSKLFPLLKIVDPQTYELLIQSEVQSFFALPWLLTWLSHNLGNFDYVTRIFDFLLSSHPSMILYLSASLISIHKNELYSLIKNNENEIGSFYMFFQSIPHKIDKKQLLSAIKTSIRFFHSVSPNILVTLHSEGINLPLHKGPLWSKDFQELFGLYYEPYQIDKKKKEKREKYISITVPSFLILFILPLFFMVLWLILLKINSFG